MGTFIINLIVLALILTVVFLILMAIGRRNINKMDLEDVTLSFKLSLVVSFVVLSIFGCSASEILISDAEYVNHKEVSNQEKLYALKDSMNEEIHGKSNAFLIIHSASIEKSSELSLTYISGDDENGYKISSNKDLQNVRFLEDSSKEPSITTYTVYKEKEVTDIPKTLKRFVFKFMLKEKTEDYHEYLITVPEGSIIQDYNIDLE